MSDEGEIVVPYEFDRAKVWGKVKDRKLVFLDTMVWINMSEAESKGLPEAQSVREKLKEGVRSGRIICPLSATLIWELYKQEHSALRTGALMEELSLNVCFASSDEVFEWEVERFAKKLAGREDDRCSREMLFVPVTGYLSSYYTLTFPAGTPDESVQLCGRVAAERAHARTLTELLKLRGGEMREYMKNMEVKPFQHHALQYRELAKGDRSKVWRIEEETIFKLYVLPAMKRLPPALKLHLLQFALNAPKDKYGGCLPSLLPELPAIHNHIEVMTRSTEDPNRKDRPNDFFDLDMMPVSLAYADAFVSFDRWVRERFLKTGVKPARIACEFCSTYAELAGWLDRL
ncbi:hypothetical protein J0H58_12560 [bacterium]|nr:hypothetical protein [bacterium]